MSIGLPGPTIRAHQPGLPVTRVLGWRHAGRRSARGRPGSRSTCPAPARHRSRRRSSTRSSACPLSSGSGGVEHERALCEAGSVAMALRNWGTPSGVSIAAELMLCARDGHDWDSQPDEAVDRGDPRLRAGQDARRRRARAGEAVGQREPARDQPGGARGAGDGGDAVALSRSRQHRAARRARRAPRDRPGADHLRHRLGRAAGHRRERLRRAGRRGRSTSATASRSTRSSRAAAARPRSRRPMPITAPISTRCSAW